MDQLRQGPGIARWPIRPEALDQPLTGDSGSPCAHQQEQGLPLQGFHRNCPIAKSQRAVAIQLVGT